MPAVKSHPAALTQAEESGVEGNARLTAATGSLLTLLLLVEGVTILDVRGFITLHAAVGLVLIGPVALKCASTAYRFARYYTGRAAYVEKGPPPTVMRLLGPVVLLSTLAVLGTGVALIVVHGRSDTWLTLHQGSFIVWVAAMTVHFLGHMIAAWRGTVAEFRRAPNDEARRGRTTRLVVVAISLFVGVGVAVAFTPPAGSWQLHHDDHTHGQER